MRATALLLLLLLAPATAGATLLDDALDSGSPAPATIAIRRTGTLAPEIYDSGLYCSRSWDAYEVEVECLLPASPVPDRPSRCSLPWVTVSTAAGSGVQGWSSCGEVGATGARTASCGTQALLVVAGRCEDIEPGRGLALYVCKTAAYGQLANYVAECRFGTRPTAQHEGCQAVVAPAGPLHLVTILQADRVLQLLYRESNGAPGLQRGGTDIAGVSDPCQQAASPDAFVALATPREAFDPVSV
ncbi:MAG TPA: hypothetical protein VNX21_01760 [Candidatus Thermoplasmatota archaeon]|nr:hypothetical protein [Candidatus Thermoplasmatota archaeon]